MRLGSADKRELERIMKGRTWASITSRIKKLQDKGALPAGVVPPAAPPAAEAPPGAGGADAPPGAGGAKAKGGKAAAAEAAAGGAGAATADSAGGKAGKTGGGKAGGKDKGAGGKDKAMITAKDEAVPAEGRVPGPMLEKMPKGLAKGLKGKYIEVYWDGDSAWFEAEVLGYDETTRLHTLRYTADAVVTDELLSGPAPEGSEIAIWRPCIKSTSRGAAAKMGAKGLAALGLG
jgi:hypothetical protein